jgi:hypothetical protein
MYVIIDEISWDEHVKTYDEMEAKLLKFPSLKAYEYRLNLKQEYCLVARYMVCDEEVLSQRAGSWECPKDYLTYKFPNICPTCKNDRFMQANYCLLCKDEDLCSDCSKENTYCQCVYNDY